MKWITALVGAALAALGACKSNPSLETDAPTATTCATNAECATPTAVCDMTGSMKCVQCTPAEHAACTGTAPACIENSCQACTSHAQCDSKACLPDGTCALETDIAYVQAGGSGSACTKATPCGTLDVGVKTNKPIVKLATGLVSDNQVTTIDGKAVMILADPGAKLGRDGSDSVVVVTGGADVKIFDLEVTGASGISSQFGALAVSPTSVAAKLALTRVKVTGVQGNGLSVSFGGTLTVSRCVVSGNAGSGITGEGTLEVTESLISDNGGNGIYATGKSLLVSRSTVTRNTYAGISARSGVISITNNFIVRNGGDANPGGLQLSNLTAGSKVEFNTIVDNASRYESGGGASTGGVSCSTSGFVASNNIIFRNRNGTTNVQTAGDCTYGNSIVMPGATPFDNTLEFANSNSEPFDYHLTATSPAADAGGACTGIDFDGDSRPFGNACDLGADEFAP
jgi:hypothetical protein